MERLQFLSNTDLLTNVYNRNAYNEVVGELKESDSSAGIIYADVNGLKKINDNFGHEAGDRAIKRTAELLLEDFFRREIYRVGGDEFVVIMPGIPEESFTHRKDKLVLRLAGVEDISISVGSFWCADTRYIELAIKEADVAMYRRKQQYYDSLPERAG